MRCRYGESTPRPITGLVSLRQGPMPDIPEVPGEGALEREVLLNKAVGDTEKEVGTAIGTITVSLISRSFIAKSPEGSALAYIRVLR